MALNITHDPVKNICSSAYSGDLIFEEDAIVLQTTNRGCHAAYLSVVEVDRFTAALRQFVSGEELTVPSDSTQRCRGRFHRCLLCGRLLWPLLHDGFVIKLSPRATFRGTRPKQHYHRSCATELADRLDRFVEENTAALLTEAL